jgi:hypothetical protein
MTGGEHLIFGKAGQACRNLFTFIAFEKYPFPYNRWRGVKSL